LFAFILTEKLLGHFRNHFQIFDLIFCPGLDPKLHTAFYIAGIQILKIKRLKKFFKKFLFNLFFFQIN